MAAFLLVKNQSSYKIEKALSYFKERGFASPTQLEVGDFVFYFYKKIAVDTVFCIKENDHQLFICGTLVYQSLSHKQSVELLFQDLIEGKFDEQKLLGNFCIIHIHKNDICLYSDALGIQNIY